MPLGHLSINVGELTLAKAHFDAVLPMMGFEEFFTTEAEFSYRPADGKPGTYLFFYPALDDREHVPVAAGLGHLAFIVPTRTAVQAVHDLVSGLGCEVVHAPQEFPQYHPGYYATFWRGPDGLVLEAVCHQDAG